MSHANYSLTFRAVIPARVGMLGQVMAAIGDAEGQVGGVDIVRSAKEAVTRDITVYARDVAHGEAIRAFREAVRLDSTCAICWWGVANAHGPNINMPMDSASGAAAYDASRRALALRGRASPVEQAYIDAQARRRDEPDAPSATYLRPASSAASAGPRPSGTGCGSARP